MDENATIVSLRTPPVQDRRRAEELTCNSYRLRPMFPGIGLPFEFTHRLAALAAVLLAALLSGISGTAQGQETDSSLASPTAVQRRIVQVNETQRELARAVDALAQSTQELRARLAQEVRQLTEQDVSVAMLRDVWLDVETLEARLERLDTGIARRREKVRRLEQAIEDNALQPTDSDTVLRLRDLVAEVALRKQRELRAANLELLQTELALRSVVIERLDIARERLTLLQSLIRHWTGTDSKAYARDPRVQLIERVIATLSRDVLRLVNEMESIVEDSPDDVARKRLLDMAVTDSLMRSEVRESDLDLLRIRDRLAKLGSLPGDVSIPLHVLRDAQAEVDSIHQRLQEREEAISQDRRLLTVQRRLIGQTALPAQKAQLLADLEGLLDFQVRDIAPLKEHAEAVHAKFDAAVDRAFNRALFKPPLLPSDFDAWSRTGASLMSLPATLYAQTVSSLGELGRRLSAAPVTSWMLLFGAVAGLVGAVIWLRRWLTKRIIQANPDGRTAIPAQALHRSLPHLVPASLWFILGNTLNVRGTALYLVLTLLLIWPIATFILALARAGLFDNGKSDGLEEGQRFYLTLRWVTILVAVLVGIVVLSDAVTLPPLLQGVVERLAMLCLLLAALPALQLRSLILAGQRERLREGRLQIRLLASLSMSIPIVLIGVGVLGLSGYVNLAWTITKYLLWLVVVAGVLALLLAILMDTTYKISTSWQKHSPERARFWVQNFVQPSGRLVSLGLVGLAAYALLRIYDWDSETPGIRELLLAGRIELFTVGNTAFTVQNLFLGVLLVFLVFWVGGWSREVSYHVAYARLRDVGVRQSLSTFTQYVVIVLGLLVTLKVIGLDLTALTVLAAGLGVGIGFGLQNIVNNFLSGLILLAERPLRMGDVVSVGDQMGEVTRIGIRSLMVRNFDQQEVVIPNSAVVSERFINWTRSDEIVRTVLMVGVSYSDDPEHAAQLIEKVLAEYDPVLRDPPPRVTLWEFADSAVVFRVQFFTQVRGAVHRLDIRSEVLRRIWYRFKEEGIQIPFPQRDVYLRMPEEESEQLGLLRPLTGSADIEKPA